MPKNRPFQNPCLARHIPNWMMDMKRDKNDAAFVLDIPGEVTRTLNPRNGRAHYSLKNPDGDIILHCVQMVDCLPWWRRLLVLLIGKYCVIEGVKYLKAGETNTFYYAQQWITGEKGKSSLKMVNNE